MWKNGSLSCENKFIFTQPGRFIVTAILLDSSATACELRVSFFVKVSPANDDQSDGEFIVMAQITAILLGLIGVFFFLEPFLEQGMKEFKEKFYIIYLYNLFLLCLTFKSKRLFALENTK